MFALLTSYSGTLNCRSRKCLVCLNLWVQQTKVLPMFLKTQLNLNIHFVPLWQITVITKETWPV